MIPPGKRTRSEVLLHLISLAFDADPEESDLKLAECLRLFWDMAIQDAVNGEPLFPEPDASPAQRVASGEERRANGHSLPRQREAERSEPGSDEAAAADEAAQPPTAQGFTGQRAAEKREIHQRLLAFCERQGAGAAVRLAEVSNGVLTDDDVRGMRAAGRFEIAKWRVLAAAMDYLETQNKT